MGPRRKCFVNAMAHYGKRSAHVDYYQGYGPTSIYIAFAGSIVVLVGLIRNVPHTKWNLRGGECALLHGFRIVGPIIVILIGILGVGLGCRLTGKTAKNCLVFDIGCHADSYGFGLFH